MATRTKNVLLSSEWSAGYAFNVNFNNDGNLNFNRNNAKSNKYRVRAALAYLVKKEQTVFFLGYTKLENEK